MAAEARPPSIPVFLLKTKSAPSDAYEDLLAASDDAGPFEPVFVPVLEHRFDDNGIAQLRDLLARRQIGNGRLGGRQESDASSGHQYGGLIFTSQRAVEAFSKVVSEGHTRPEAEDETAWPHLQNVPIYSVGPATTRALRAVRQQPPLLVSGEHTGNGEDLAYYIQQDYAGWGRPRTATGEDAAASQPADVGPRRPAAPDASLLPLLFVVGEKRRDIIPKVLAGSGTDNGAPRIGVDETVVYGTGVMPSFADDFQHALDATQGRSMRWVVVFSPTGCDSMLAALGLLDPETGKARRDADRARTAFVATIGPTTRSYLQNTFGFEPDVCADEPSPQGVLRGISQYMDRRAAS